MYTIISNAISRPLGQPPHSKFFQKHLHFCVWGKQCNFPKLHFFRILAHCVIVEVAFEIAFRCHPSWSTYKWKCQSGINLPSNTPAKPKSDLKKKMGTFLKGAGVLEVWSSFFLVEKPKVRKVCVLYMWIANT